MPGSGGEASTDSPLALAAAGDAPHGGTSPASPAPAITSAAIGQAGVISAGCGANRLAAVARALSFPSSVCSRQGLLWLEELLVFRLVVLDVGCGWPETTRAGGVVPPGWGKSSPGASGTASPGPRGKVSPTPSLPWGSFSPRVRVGAWPRKRSP